MRGDLNDQFQRAQSAANGDNTSERVIIGVAIFMAVCFIAMIVGITVFVVKTLDKFVEAEPATNINPELVTQINDLNNQIFNGGKQNPDGGGSIASDSNFKFGTVNGTSYYSEFSGVSFTAPADWLFTSYASDTVSTSPRDLSATGNHMSSSVVIQYESKKANGYQSTDDALKSTRIMASEQNNTIVDNKASTKWGGNKFVGIIYKNEVVASYPTYYEVLVAEVNGYMLRITLSAGSENDLAIVRSYFK
ncbi:MAG: hypothetical protein K5836_01595 [Clostridiales bacterium]|nr:hypothetical protein [Clostridiales bacterium]